MPTFRQKIGEGKILDPHGVCCCFSRLIWPVSGERGPLLLLLFLSLLLSCLSQVLGVFGLVDLSFKKRFIHFVFSL